MWLITENFSVDEAKKKIGGKHQDGYNKRQRGGGAVAPFSMLGTPDIHRKNICEI